MNTTIHTFQGQNKTELPLEKKRQLPLFQPTGIQCSYSKVEISSFRKFLGGSQCPEAQPLLRPEKTKATQTCTLQNGHGIPEQEAGSCSPGALARVLGFPSSP